MYKATNIDTDKALQAIEYFRRRQSEIHQRELHGIQKYYEGIEKGLNLAESLFECSNYEKDEPETTHTKIQYNNREYTIAEMCERMAKLEKMLEAAEAWNRRAENETN